MSKFNGVKTNNAKTNAKELIRRGVLEHFNTESKVLEVFCGAGVMYRAVWHECSDYLGIDKVKFFDERKTICGDARKAINLVDIDNYNIFDIDAYGSPYEILHAILDRVSKEEKTLAFILTDGSSMDLRLGQISKGLRALTGINQRIVKKASIIHYDLVNIVINNVATHLGGRVVHKKFAKGKTGAAMIYYAFVIKRD